MLAPANYCFLHQELCFFVCLQPVKKLHSAPLRYEIEDTSVEFFFLFLFFLCTIYECYSTRWPSISVTKVKQCIQSTITHCQNQQLTHVDHFSRQMSPGSPIASSAYRENPYGRVCVCVTIPCSVFTGCLSHYVT